MNQALREKIALVVFAITVVVVFGAILAYMILGHSWNIAARNIDEHRGAMEGYSAIVFYGTDRPTLEESESENAPVPINTVLRSYKDKGASTLRIDVMHPGKYEGDDIFYLDGYRVGVFYAEPGITAEGLIRKTEYFVDHKVDYIFCLTDNARFVDDYGPAIDIIVSRHRQGDVKAGQSVNGHYIAHVPAVGSIGAVLISPEQVLSAKVISKVPTRADDAKANEEAAKKAQEEGN